MPPYSRRRPPLWCIIQKSRISWGSYKAATVARVKCSRKKVRRVRLNAVKRRFQGTPWGIMADNVRQGSFAGVRQKRPITALSSIPRGHSLDSRIVLEDTLLEQSVSLDRNERRTSKSLEDDRLINRRSVNLPMTITKSR